MDLLLGQVGVLGRDWVDCRRDEPLLDLLVFRQGKNRGVVLLDELAQIIPGRAIRCREIDMALPEPGHVAIGKMLDRRQRVRVVYDNGVAILQMQAGGIFEHDMLVDRPLGIGQRDIFTLKCIVQLLG